MYRISSLNGHINLKFLRIDLFKKFEKLLLNCFILNIEKLALLHLKELHYDLSFLLFYWNMHAKTRSL